jgi:hypothetical protein
MKNVISLSRLRIVRRTGPIGSAARLLVALAFGIAVSFGQPARDSAVTRVFCGSSPWDEPIRQVLGISTNDAPELIEWKLTLHRDGKTLEPSRYELRCDYGKTVPGTPGIGASKKTLERQGKWTIGKGTRTEPDAVRYDLEGAFSVREIGANLLHILTSDRVLMVGNGSWSYTLNAMEKSEKPVDPELARTVPDMSYQIAPLATGATVFGVFEGRTPAQGIAKQLKTPIPVSAEKAKWRVTLYQEPDTKVPTTYKIEGTFFRPSARAGNWTTLHGRPGDPAATIFQLSSPTGPALLLLKGDDNVLFLLDEERAPLVGHCEFSYTLNRRTPPSEISSVERQP